MNAKWETHKIKEVCEIRPAKRESKSKLNDSDLISFVPMEDLPTTEKYLTATQDRELREVYSGYTYFADGDVLFAKITPCFQNGKLAIAKNLNNGIGFGSSEFVVLRPSEMVDDQFLYYFLSRATFREEGMARMSGAVGHQRVPKEFIEEYQIPLPPLDEQKRIVDILDEAFKSIAHARDNTEKNLAGASELNDSLIDRVLFSRREEWEEVPLGDIATFKNGLNYTRDSRGQTLPIVGVGDFKDNFYVPIPELDTVTIDGDLDSAFALRQDDILTVRSNGSRKLIGRCMLVPEVATTISYSGFVIRIRFDTRQMCPRFLLQFLKSRKTVDKLTRGGGGANINNINQTKLSKLPILFPRDLREQQRIADIMDGLSEMTGQLESIYEQKMSDLDELKQSLLNKAITGQLAANNSNLNMVG